MFSVDVELNREQCDYLAQWKIMVEPGPQPAMWLCDIMVARMALEEIRAFPEVGEEVASEIERRAIEKGSQADLRQPP